MKKNPLTFAAFSSLDSKKSSPKFTTFSSIYSKKNLVYLFLTLFILASMPLVFANNDLDETNNEKIETPDLDRVSETLAKDREIPEELHLVSRILFGVEETISISFFIILLMLWLIILLVLKEIMEFLPFFKGFTVWVGAIIVNLIFGVSGAFSEATTFYISVFDFWLFAEWFLAGQVLAIIVLVLLGFIIMTLIRYIRMHAEREESEMRGFKSGLDLSFTKKIVSVWTGTGK